MTREIVPPLPPLADGIREEHRAHVLAVVRRLRWVSASDEEDVVQNVLVKATRAANPRRLSARAFLSGIAAVESRRWARRVRRRCEVPLDEAPEQVFDHTPEDAAIIGEERAIVRAASAALPAIFREVLTLADMSGEAMPDVAREIGIPLNTGYTRQRLARDRVREAMARARARRR